MHAMSSGGIAGRTIGRSIAVLNLGVRPLNETVDKKIRRRTHCNDSEMLEVTIQVRIKHNTFADNKYDY